MPPGSVGVGRRRGPRWRRLLGILTGSLGDDAAQLCSLATKMVADVYAGVGGALGDLVAEVYCLLGQVVEGLSGIVCGISRGGRDPLAAPGAFLRVQKVHGQQAKACAGDQSTWEILG